MAKAVVVRCETRPDAGDRNQHLIEQVFAELNAEDPPTPQVLLKRGTEVNQTGQMDAVFHNAGVFLEPSRAATADGHAKTLAVNTLAPYLLTGLTGRPDRLIYLSSGLHHAGAGSLRDIDWTSRPWDAARAYSESKLYVRLATGMAPTMILTKIEIAADLVGDTGIEPVTSSV